MRQEHITPPVFAGLTGVAVFAVVMLGVAGELSRKVVGILYFSPDHKQVVISHLSFFGGRKDVCLDVKDIIPLSETSEDSEDVFWKVYTYSNPGSPSFFIPPRYGGLRDKKAF